MKNILKVSTLALVAALAVGCSSKTTERLDAVDATAQQAQQTAQQAQQTAQQALSAAQQAQQTADEANERAARMLTKATRK
ncbi:hypothetical protein DKL61_15310 [Gammaproteobacteria bacterium ESL0073]|uniref:Lipoprotein n=1 Tax=Entomomonas moraniae TaxID=2213226 RepID=A0A3Q9JP05_9GAMM|nr:Lpp/OprI family alanine-zipper lipoprotein [Entomomonas moraniae]AWM81594.1 hypothetical protein DKL61_15310 [Gammaproteobacteria bacterium ESL0073]AZS51581.1 hypothetical protein DM558_12730 [Entomomonas moraniae]